MRAMWITREDLTAKDIVHEMGHAAGLKTVAAAKAQFGTRPRGMK